MLRVFPNFIFHFDSVDDSTVKKYTSLIKKLGGQVDQFFSRKVTHVITTRRIPDENAPVEAGPSTAATMAERTGAHKLFRPSFLATRTATTKAGSGAARSRPIPLFSERNPFQERPKSQYSPNDILVKAQSFGIKVWRFSKLQEILMRLLNIKPRDVDKPAPTQQDLSQMLEKEKVYGTTERDPATARPTFHYFDKSAFFVMVEDATLEHRPIMCTEYEYTRENRQQHMPPPWPVVYGQTPGRCPFTYYPPKKSLARDDDGDSQSAARPSAQQSLRRAVSLNNMVRSNLGPAFRPQPAAIRTNDQRQNEYPMASGNSVSITSNIASTTSNIFTDQQSGATVGLPRNRRVAELNRRMHMSNAALNRGQRTLNASPASVLAGSTGNGLGIRRDSGSPIVGSPAVSRAAAAAAAAPTEQGSTVRRMLGLEDKNRRANVVAHLAGGGLQRSVSASAVNKPTSAKKPGYCENCRVKYDDFMDHIYDRKHRKFATNEANFVDIDALIMRVQRPVRSISEDELSSGFFDFEAIPSSQPEENVRFTDSEEEVEEEEEEEEGSLSVGLPEEGMGGGEYGVLGEVEAQRASVANTEAILARAGRDVVNHRVLLLFDSYSSIVVTIHLARLSTVSVVGSSVFPFIFPTSLFRSFSSPQAFASYTHRITITTTTITMFRRLMSHTALSASNFQCLVPHAGFSLSQFHFCSHSGRLCLMLFAVAGSRGMIENRTEMKCIQDKEKDSKESQRRDLGESDGSHNAIFANHAADGGTVDAEPLDDFAWSCHAWRLRFGCLQGFFR